MELTDRTELKLIENYRLCLEKARQPRNRVGEVPIAVGRSSSMPDPMDSDDQINFSVSVSVSSVLSSMSEYQVALRESDRDPS